MAFLKTFFSVKNLPTQVILGGLVLLFTILGSVADSKVSEFNNKLLFVQNYQNNVLLNEIMMSDLQHHYEILGLFGAPIDPTSIASGPNQSEVIKSFFEEFKSGKINKNDFLKNLSLTFFQQANGFDIDYKERLKESNALLEQGTVWGFLGKVFTATQVFLAILTIYFGYKDSRKSRVIS